MLAGAGPNACQLQLGAMTCAPKTWPQLTVTIIHVR